MVQKQEGGGEGRRGEVPEDREGEFPVLNLVSSDRGADTMPICLFVFHQRGNMESMSGQRRQEISLKQREYPLLLGTTP